MRETQLASHLRVNRLENRDVPAGFYALGAGPGGGPQVQLFDSNDQRIASFLAFEPAFRGGVRVAMADINLDGIDDVICAAGPGGGPRVRVFDGAQLQANVVSPIRDFLAYAAAFNGGVYVAAGDVNGDGQPDIITGADAGGGPHVRAFDGNNGNILMSFYAYDPNFTGGVRVAAADLGGDQITSEIVTGAGPGGGPHVCAYNYDPTAIGNTNRITSFYAFDPSYRGGVFVGAGAVSNNQDNTGVVYNDILIGSGLGMAPTAKVYRLLDAINDANGQPNYVYFQATQYQPLSNGFTGGVHIGTVDRNGAADILTGPGQGGGPQVRIVSRVSVTDLQTYEATFIGSFYAFDPAFMGGVFVS